MKNQNNAHSIVELFTEMKKYPTSFFLYFAPAAILMYLLTYTLSFYNGITSYTKEELISFIITILIYIIVFYLIDSFVAHFSYTQYNNQKKTSNKTKKEELIFNLKSSFKNYHIYLIQRFILLVLMFLPMLVLVLFAELISLDPYKTIGDVWLILLLISFITITLICIFTSLYLSMAYSYLPVSSHFSTTKNIIKFKEYRKVVKKNKKTIFIKILILMGLVLLFQIIYWMYSALVSFIPQNVVLLFFQAIGVCITMTISYFSNTYLFFTYKESVSKIESNSKK